MPLGILEINTSDVNKIEICTNKINHETLTVNDVMENIFILLRYIISKNNGRINMKKFIKTNFNQKLVFIFGVFTSVLFLAKPSEFWFEIIIGIWVSFLFYFMVTAFPAYLHKERQKMAFFVYYKEFKQDVILQLFHLINYQEDDRSELQDKLLDTKEFRDFFRQPSPIQGQNYTHVLLNAIAEPENQQFVERIAESFRALENEIDFLTRSLAIEDTSLLIRLRSLSRLMGDGRLNPEINAQREDESRFVGALFEVFSGWNNISGETGDFIKEWVGKI